MDSAYMCTGSKVTRYQSKPWTTTCSNSTSRVSSPEVMMLNWLRSMCSGAMRSSVGCLNIR